jgi:NADH dehydrogenase
MLLFAGGTGRLGTAAVELLIARGIRVRVMTRDPARAQHLAADLVEIVQGDARNPAEVGRAVEGATTVVSAIQGFDGVAGNSPRTVDAVGNANLIKAAERIGAEHFVLVSVQGAGPEHPMELARAKCAAEQKLRQSQLAWTIIRPTPFMEFWASLVGQPLVDTGRTRVFGSGQNPINFVSVHDVARFVVLAVTDPALRGVMVEAGGPENLTLNQVAEVFERVTGKSGKKDHVPVPMMRLMSVLLRPVNPTLARQIRAGVIMDTFDMTWNPGPNRRLYPSLPQTRLEAVLERTLKPVATPHQG